MMPKSGSSVISRRDVTAVQKHPKTPRVTIVPDCEAGLRLLDALDRAAREGDSGRLSSSNPTASESR